MVDTTQRDECMMCERGHPKHCHVYYNEIGQAVVEPSEGSLSDSHPVGGNDWVKGMVS
jgi:hypothetical protein